jgi:hypothetical protein
LTRTVPATALAAPMLLMGPADPGDRLLAVDQGPLWRTAGDPRRQGFWPLPFL